mmetsp:Transcript_23399/g.47692  ORF Transcript_23399/g.47692 Transcript_23399/m.47692 type:complete len:92 (+) Transcript_23399:17-292(+)
MPVFLPLRVMIFDGGCKPASPDMYAGAGYDGETNAFGFFDGCTFTPSEEYPPGLYGGPTEYPPDQPTECSPNCYMQTPESIRGKGVRVAFL